MSTELLRGQIVASFGRRCVVETEAGIRYSCTTRGKRHDYVCGDYVQIRHINAEQAVIESLEPRTHLLYRQDQHKSKLIAANIDQVMLVFAPQPTPNEYLLHCGLVAARAANIEPCLILNKYDEPQHAVYWTSWQRWSQSLGVRVLRASAKLGDVTEVRAHCQGRNTAFVGQSGVGKSTLLNVLYPEARARVGELSAHNAAGQHTTTHACRYRLDEQSSMMDVPGLQSFGIQHLDLDDLRHAFDEFTPFVSACRFQDCRHDQEPHCAVKQAAIDGAILPERLAFWQKLSREQHAKESYEKN
jgi:ribosome biogenesis GTPase